MVLNIFADVAAGPLDINQLSSSTSTSTNSKSRYNVVMDASRRAWMTHDVTSNAYTDPNRPHKSGAVVDPYELFDKETYLAGDRVHLGQDAYAKTKFNQLASDNLPIDRTIPDTRNHM